MNSFSTTSIGDLVEFQRGYDLPKSQFVKGHYPVRSSNGILGYHNEFKCKGPGITIGRSGTVGYPHYIEENFFPHNTTLFIKNFKGNYPKYIFYLIENLKLNDWKSGSGVPTLNRNHLHPLEIRAHLDLNEQKQIAKVLSDLDAKIEVNNKVNAELEAMAKTIYDYWFVQFDYPNEKGQPYKSSGGKMVYNEELKREIPEGWVVAELKDFIKSNRGVSYSGKDINGEGIPMINLNSFNTDSTYKPEGIKCFSGSYNDSKVLKPLDLVMCNTQQTAINPKTDIIGKSLLVPDIFENEIVSSHHVTTIKVEKENLKFYLNTLFNTEYFHRYISGYATGTNILGLHFSGVLTYKTEIPHYELLKKYAVLITNIEKRKSITIKENQKLLALRDWLLPMLMNGQVTVREAKEPFGMVAEEGVKYNKISQ